MNQPMRRAAIVSAVLHFLLLVALIVSLPAKKPDEQPDLAAVSVDFVGPTAPVQQSDASGKTAAPTKTPTPVTAPKATQAPIPQPLSDAPPPPPPPPPPPSVTPPPPHGYTWFLGYSDHEMP
ncbi:cell envelope integrity protein TolA, partial [Acidisoma cellulosilytica]|nr:cell envelope integrity protein TolA [Acidisoma cellulosilyticum]